jgi:hypothetical protein
MKLFVCEKPSQAKQILIALGKENDVAIVAPSISSYSFIYPKVITYKETPYKSKSIEYKNNYSYGEHDKVFKIINGSMDVNKVKIPQLENFFESKKDRISSYKFKEDVYSDAR